MSDNKKHDINNETFMQMTSDCAVFRRTRGFDKKAAIEEDIDFSIAFNLLVHKNVEMVSETFINNFIAKAYNIIS